MSFYVWHDSWRVGHPLTWFCFCDIFHNTLCTKRAQGWLRQLLFDCKSEGILLFTLHSSIVRQSQTQPVFPTMTLIQVGMTSYIFFFLAIFTQSPCGSPPRLIPNSPLSIHFFDAQEVLSPPWSWTLRPDFWVIIGLHTFPTSFSALPQVRLDTAAPCPSWDGCDCLQTAGLNLDCIFSVWGCLWNTALIHWSPSKATSNCSIREHSLFLTFLQGVKSTSLPVGSSKIDRNCLHVHKKLIVFFLLCLWEWMFAFEISIFLLFWYLVLVQMCKTLIKTRFLFKVYIQEMKIICMHR